MVLDNLPRLPRDSHYARPKFRVILQVDILLGRCAMVAMVAMLLQRYDLADAIVVRSSFESIAHQGAQQ